MKDLYKDDCHKLQFLALLCRISALR